MIVGGIMRVHFSLLVLLLCLIRQIDVIHGELSGDAQSSCEQLFLHGDAGFGKSSYQPNKKHTSDCRHGQFRHDIAPRIRYADTGWGGPRGPEHADVQNWFRDKTPGKYEGSEDVNVQSQFPDKMLGKYDEPEDTNVQNQFPDNSPRKYEGPEDVDVEHRFRRTPEQYERQVQFDVPCSDTDASMFESRDHDNDDGVKSTHKQGFYIERQTLVVVSLCIMIILCSCVVYVGGLFQILRLRKVCKKEIKERSRYCKTKIEAFENHCEESKTSDRYAYLETRPCVQETSIQSESTRPTTSLSCISTIPAENEEEILDNRRDNTHKDFPDPQENVFDENVFDILKLKCISDNESETGMPTILADPFSMSDLKTSKLKVLSDTYYDELPCPDATSRKKLVKTEIDREKTVKDNKKTFKSDDGNGLLGNEYDQLESYNEKDETCVKTLMKKENVKSQEKPQESLYIYSSGCSGYPKKSTSSEGPMRSSDTIDSSETGADYTANRDGDVTPSVQWRDTKVPCESSFHGEVDDSIDYESHSSCLNVSGYESVEDEEVKNEIELSDETKNDEILVRKHSENKLHVISEQIEENDVPYTARKNDKWIDKIQDKNSAHVEIIDISTHTKLQREDLDGADQGSFVLDGLDEGDVENIKALDDDCKYQESNVNDCLAVVQFHDIVSEDEIESKENVKEQNEFLYHLGVVYTHLLSVCYCTEVWVTYFITKIEVKYPEDLTEEQQHESECVAGEWSRHYEDGDESLRIDSGFESYVKLSMDSIKPNDFIFDDKAFVATDNFEIHKNSSYQSFCFDCGISSYKQMPVECNLHSPISPDSEQIEKRALQPSSRPEPPDTFSTFPFRSPSQNAPWTHFYRGLECKDVPVAFCLVKSEFQKNGVMCGQSCVGSAGGEGHQDVTKHSKTMDILDRVSSLPITTTCCPIISIGLTGKYSSFNLSFREEVAFARQKLIRNVAKDSEAIMKADTEITDDDGYETASQGQHDYGKDSVIENILEPKAPLIGHTQAYDAHMDKNNDEDLSDCLILLTEVSSERSDQEKTNLLDTCDNNVDENQTEKEQVVIVELVEDYSRDDRTHDVERDLSQKQPEDPAEDEGVVMTSVQLGHTEPPGLTKDNKENSYVPDSVYSNNNEDDFDNTGDFCINNMFGDIHVEGETARIHAKEIPTIIQVDEIYENNDKQINNLDGQNLVNDESHDEVPTQTIRRIRKRIRRKRKRKESTQNYRHNNEDCSLSSDDEAEKVSLDVEMEASVYLCSMSTRVSTLLNQTKLIGDELEASINQLEQVFENISLTELTNMCQHAENLPGKSEASSKRKRKKIDQFCPKCHRSKFEFTGKCTSDCHVIVFGNTCTDNVAESRPEINEQYIVEITKSIDSGFASIESLKSCVISEIDEIKRMKERSGLKGNENLDRNLENVLKDKEEMIKVELKQYWMEQLYHPMGFRPAVNDLSAYPAGLGGYFQRLEQGPVSQEESLSYEWLRLHSLRNYQGNGSVIQLSRHGFYHDEEHGPNATRCYRCNLLYSDWNYFDNIQEIHRRLSPNCPLLNENEELSGSHVSLPSDSNASRSAPEGNATAVNDRQAPVTTVNRETASVENVTSSLAGTHIGGRNLDTEGFPSQPTEDRDNSQFARATPGISGTHRAAPVLSNVRTTTHGRARHTPHTDVNNTATGARSNESSARANTTTTSMSQSSNQASINTNTPTSGGPEKVRERAQGNGGFSTAAPRRDDPSRDEQLYGINNPSLVNVENPKHRDYTTIDSRTNSFTSLWPTYLDQTPRQMSEAGFFYAGVADFTRCFACGGGLRNWEAGDDPCLEHTRWYPRCEYMNKLKGSRYVDAVSRRQEQHLAEQRRRQQQQHEERQQAQNRNSTPQDPLSTPAAAVLLEMGYSRERIREAITTVRRNTGHNSVSAEQALLWILDQDERQQSQNHTATSTASQSTTTSAATTGATSSVSVSVSSLASAQSSSSSSASSSSSSNATSSASSSASASVSSAQGQRSQGQGQSLGNKKNGDKKGDDKKENKSEGKEPQRKGAEGEQPSSSKKKKNGKKKNKGGGTNSGNLGGANSNVGGANSNVGGSNGSNVGGANGSNVGGANADVGNEGGATGGGEAEERADSLSELREMDTQSLRAENQKLREMQTCKICMDKPVNMTLLPCGHLVCCESCVSHLRKCPICRKRIEGSVKTFMS